VSSADRPADQHEHQADEHPGEHQQIRAVRTPPGDDLRQGVGHRVLGTARRVQDVSGGCGQRASSRAWSAVSSRTIVRTRRRCRCSRPGSPTRAGRWRSRSARPEPVIRDRVNGDVAEVRGGPATRQGAVGRTGRDAPPRLAGE
jgi:hypothetical protein